MKSFEQIQQETAEIQFDFLLADLKTADTFLDIAGTTHNGETRARNLQNATAAYTAVERFFPRVRMTEQQSVELQEKLRLLKVRIQLAEHNRLPKNPR